MPSLESARLRATRDIHDGLVDHLGPLQQRFDFVISALQFSGCSPQAPVAILWHSSVMVTRAILTTLAAVCCSGCFQMTTVMKINGDGSGTVEHRMLFTTQALAQIRQFSALGGRGQAVDPTSEQQAREMAAALGPGVTYVSSTA